MMLLKEPNSFPGLVFPCFGVHPLQGFEKAPHSVRIQDLETALPLFQMYRDDIAAVGEIGFNFTPWCVSTIQECEEQLLVFRKQLELSRELDLPVNVYSRSAAKVTITTMKGQGTYEQPKPTRIVIYFAGRPSVAEDGLQAEYYFSFLPAVGTSHQRAKLIKQIPLEWICLETDSPALGPVKHVSHY
ncbi:hypothetical protein P4O66_008840 [Electrophorus voltai]|uniref:TatD DNase domain containing 3 n=1 Tax=Electrophorus voltai TaxID=2609070 RepID=A0AAD8ZAC4_9TELE|nr:hypothetical protein P4O66_008840 [Electrophorus voltai]